jgi:hypothetical protein
MYPGIHARPAVDHRIRMLDRAAVEQSSARHAERGYTAAHRHDQQPFLA